MLLPNVKVLVRVGLRSGLDLGLGLGVRLDFVFVFWCGVLFFVALFSRNGVFECGYVREVKL
jgi:hypothetical protein